MEKVTQLISYGLILRASHELLTICPEEAKPKLTRARDAYYKACCNNASSLVADSLEKELIELVFDVMKEMSKDISSLKNNV